MKKIPLPIILFGLMFIAGYAGFFVFQWIYDPKPVEPPNPAAIAANDMLLLGLPRPEFSMPDLEGNNRHISEWDGKVVVLNFWATWCPPCRKELPVFVDLQNQYADQGLQFIGIAVDTPENVQAFFEQLPLNYPNLIGEAEAMKITSIYGNDIGALPYTVIIDRNGKIMFTRKGELPKQEAEKLIGSMFKPTTPAN